MSFRSVRLDPDQHDTGGFACGEPSLDHWLHEQAVSATARRTARTWVWVGHRDTVVGYYALAAHKVSRDAIPPRVGRGGPAEVPAVFLARLALSAELRGQGWGEVLPADVLTRVVEATQTVAARLVVVDALDEKVAHFYGAVGFRRVPGRLLLAQTLSDIEAALGCGTDLV